jgi:hypothetical protein
MIFIKSDWKGDSKRTTVGYHGFVRLGTHCNRLNWKVNGKSMIALWWKKLNLKKNWHRDAKTKEQIQVNKRRACALNEVPVYPFKVKSTKEQIQDLFYKLIFRGKTTSFILLINFYRVTNFFSIIHSFASVQWMLDIFHHFM